MKKVRVKFHDVSGRRVDCYVDLNLNEVDINNIIISNDFIKNENFVKEILVYDDAFYVTVFGIDTLKEYESMPFIIDDHDEDDGDQ